MLGTESSRQAAFLGTVVVETDDVATYVKEIGQGAKIMEDAGRTGKIRIWHGVYAGHPAGSVVVTVEYPTLAALAKDREMLSGTEAFSKWLKDLSKIRKIVSDSVYEELW